MADPQSSAALSAHPKLPEGAPRAGVLHVRHRHTDRFTAVGNHLAQHSGLSAAAIGFGVYIQSLPDGASVTVKALTLRFREGETTVRRALNELEAAGYLERRRVPLGGGRVATRTFFFDKPGCAAEPLKRGQVPATPLRDQPVGASVRVQAKAASAASHRQPAVATVQEAREPTSSPGYVWPTLDSFFPPVTYIGSLRPWRPGWPAPLPLSRSPALSPRTSHAALSPFTARRASLSTA